jgi:MoaD family protein
MILLKSIWGLLFRLFPCPTPVGLRRVGSPGRQSPVLVTCNFHTTVKRLTHLLGKAGVDAWLLVADSKGVNVWCAAGGDEFNTQSVISAVKTSGVGDRVDHRRLVLPPLGAPGIRIDEVHRRTRWSTSWGPVYAEDLPRYLNRRFHRDESMRRVAYGWRERLDTGLGSLFPFYSIGALIILALAHDLLVSYLAIGASTFLLFMLACPWLPGKRGLTKALLLDLALAAVLVASELLSPAGFSMRAELGIAMVAPSVRLGARRSGPHPAQRSRSVSLAPRNRGRGERRSRGDGADRDPQRLPRASLRARPVQRLPPLLRGLSTGCVGDGRGEARGARPAGRLHGLPGLPGAVRDRGHPRAARGEPSGTEWLGEAILQRVSLHRAGSSTLAWLSFYATIRAIVGAKTLEIDLADGSSIQDLLDRVIERCPPLAEKLLEADGKLSRSVQVFVDGRSASHLPDGLETKLGADEAVDIFPAVAGG